MVIKIGKDRRRSKQARKKRKKRKKKERPAETILIECESF
jgi:hypothetical protein